MAEKRRARVFFEDNDVVARKLRDNPGEWFLLGTGEKKYQRVAAQTAWRMRDGRLSDFPINGDGYWMARATADEKRPNPVLGPDGRPVGYELYGCFVPTDGAADRLQA